jgi:tRNA(Arg) A34 adenosine deaminase TadA
MASSFSSGLMKTASNFTLNLSITLPAWIGEIPDLHRSYRTDEERMRLTIQLSRENVLRGTGGPFGAAVFRQSDHTLVSVGVNCVELLQNSVLHAEVLALMFAEQAVRSYTLNAPEHSTHELYTSCDPCAMCLGAILWSGVRRVVCGAHRDDAERIGFIEGPVFPASYQYLVERGIQIERGFLQAEAREVFDLYQQKNGLVYNG